MVLHRVSYGDANEFVKAVKDSEALHEQWVFPPKTPAAFKSFVDKCTKPTARCYLLRASASKKKLVGYVSVSQIQPKDYERAVLGYATFAPYQEQGFMTAGLRLVIDSIFDEFDLHRLEAEIQPGNEASRRLVKRLGFHFEGLSVGLVKIQGEWKDHERWAFINPAHKA